MTEADLQFIERELGINLPEAYKHAVTPFAIPALVGNTEYQLWDDARRLVELNLELRAGSRFRPAWPPHLFAVGDPHGDELIALDIRSPDGPVWWLDHGMVGNKSSYQSHSKFADWVAEFYNDLRSDLQDDGYDPNAAPTHLKAAQARSMNRSSLGCFILIVVAASAIAFFIYIRNR